MRRILLAGLLASIFAVEIFAQDPPSRIARLNYVNGNVSMQPAGVEDWAPAELNRPFTTGDTVYSDLGSRAEFHLDTAVLRLGEATSFGFLTLTDQAVQLRLTQGDLYVTLRTLEPNQTFEVDSPNVAVSLLRPGVYRFRIASNGSLTFVVVREGQAELTGGGQAFNLAMGNSAAVSGSTELSYNIELAPQPDDLDSWSQNRDAEEARYQAQENLPQSVVGYEDMGQYGNWQDNSEYGQVWYPTTVPAGWAPYHDGHWAWIEPWGWTWVDDAPWGFAPFHYGRWAYVSGRWGWCPGPIVIAGHRPPLRRPVYAPALVAWFGGSHFGVGITSGGPSLGWVPLGYGEVYTPAYHCSPQYFNRVNVSNTTVVKNVNITNVYNNVYINKTVYNQRYVNIQAPNALTAMPQAAFASGRSVNQAGRPIAAGQMRNFQPQAATLVSPPVAPTRQAVIASNVNRPYVPRPAPQVAARAVVVRNQPASVPAAFADRQAYLQQHAGQPHDFASMHNQVSPPVAAPTTVAPAATVRPAVIQAPPAQMRPAPPANVRPTMPTRPVENVPVPAPVKPVTVPPASRAIEAQPGERFQQRTGQPPVQVQQPRPSQEVRPVERTPERTQERRVEQRAPAPPKAAAAPQQSAYPAREQRPAPAEHAPKSEEHKNK